MAFYCYMVICANGALYTGWTTDPIRREKEHNAGRGARYTRMNGPVRLAYIEEVTGHVEALKREAHIKRMTSKTKWRLIEAESNIISQFFEDKKDVETKQSVQ